MLRRKLVALWPLASHLAGKSSRNSAVASLSQDHQRLRERRSSPVSAAGIEADTSKRIRRGLWASGAGASVTAGLARYKSGAATTPRSAARARAESKAV